MERWNVLCTAYEQAIGQGNVQAADAILSEMEGEANARHQQLKAASAAWQAENSDYEELFGRADAIMRSPLYDD